MSQTKDTFRIDQRGAWVKFFNNTTQSHSWDEKSFPHYVLFNDVMKFLGSIGFYVSKNKEIQKHYPVLSKDHKAGQYLALKFRANRYPVGFEIQFFQDEVRDNPAGGFYDFDKFDKMPYLIKKQLILTQNKLRNYFSGLGYEDLSEPVRRTPEDEIKYRMLESCHHPLASMDDVLPKGRTEDGIKNVNGGRNVNDRDGKEIEDGEFKYARRNDGRYGDGYLRRGIVYHSINAQWWMICGSHVETFSAHELFDLSPNEPRGRVAPDRMPQSVIDRKKATSDMSNKELIAELKRRGYTTKKK